MEIKKIKELADLNAICKDKRNSVNEFLKGRIETLREQAMAGFRDFFRSEGWIISSDLNDKRQVAKHQETIVSLDPTIPTIILDKIELDSLTLKISDPKSDVEILIMETGDIKKPVQLNRNLSNDTEREIELVRKEIASIDDFMNSLQDYRLSYVILSNNPEAPYLYGPEIKFKDLLQGYFK